MTPKGPLGSAADYNTSPTAYPNCTKRFANIGKDDSAILKKTPAQRKRLLNSALHCWAIITPWLKTFIKDTQPPREKLVRLMELFQQANKRQGTSGCPADKTITENVAKDPLMPLDYTPVELRACLTSSVLRKYLDFLSQQAFTEEQAAAVKLKLDEASTIIKKYTDSEQFLDSIGVFAIGTRYICLLDAKQLSYMDEEAVK
ncbi:hypothetical protein lerEdw1_015942 [Lerista edwardsae]|nr:hypothetical protein lerEdw1_015942 [Lerista edwardsae]